jgi:hypothetical protein
MQLIDNWSNCASGIGRADSTAAELVAFICVLPLTLMAKAVASSPFRQLVIERSPGAHRSVKADIRGRSLAAVSV